MTDEEKQEDAPVPPAPGEEQETPPQTEIQQTPPPAPPMAEPAEPAPAPERETVREIRYVEKPEPERKGRLRTIGLVVLVLVLVVVAALATLSVAINNPWPAAVYPYTTTYEVWFPLGEPVDVAGTRMIALSIDDEMLISVNGETEKLIVGQDKMISERRAIIRMLGATVVDTNFQIFLNYRGKADQNTAHFYLMVKTSEQVPQFIINYLLPRDIRAVPA
ncbi:MAG: hypothetical protein KO206_08880 [Methanomicrobiaceae archaeon]|nr:hypothetical protein [Methanomicrobiaceae archaeon]MDD5418417.1 hypothetical protein [Methanomicrobiaceae archaeon]